jgi:hypothetical protein
MYTTVDVNKRKRCFNFATVKKGPQYKLRPLLFLLPPLPEHFLLIIKIYNFTNHRRH